jgi:glycosyltransferase involved in cell wall biosynthesis
LVPPKNHALMAKAILQLLKNPRQAQELGQRAQREAKERFSIKKHVTSIQHIYQKILDL